MSDLLFCFRSYPFQFALLNEPSLWDKAYSSLGISLWSAKPSSPILLCLWQSLGTASSAGFFWIGTVASFLSDWDALASDPARCLSSRPILFSLLALLCSMDPVTILLGHKCPAIITVFLNSLNPKAKFYPHLTLQGMPWSL